MTTRGDGWGGCRGGSVGCGHGEGSGRCVPLHGVRVDLAQVGRALRGVPGVGHGRRGGRGGALEPGCAAGPPASRPTRSARPVSEIAEQQVVRTHHRARRVRPRPRRRARARPGRAPRRRAGRRQVHPAARGRPRYADGLADAARPRTALRRIGPDAGARCSTCRARSRSSRSAYAPGASGPTPQRLLLADENDLATLLGHIEEHDPALVVVDSVQTIASRRHRGPRGRRSTQVVEVTQVLSRVAKSRRMPMLHRRPVDEGLAASPARAPSSTSSTPSSRSRATGTPRCGCCAR